MEKLLEILMRYKIIMALLMLILVGGMAFWMGHSSATTQENEPQVVKSVDNEPDKKASSESKDNPQSVEEALKKSEDKANADLKKMEKAIEENNKRIEEDDRYGKTIDGTDIPAPPKFNKSTVPTRKADFQN